MWKMKITEFGIIRFVFSMTMKKCSTNKWWFENSKQSNHRSQGLSDNRFAKKKTTTNNKTETFREKICYIYINSYHTQEISPKIVFITIMLSLSYLFTQIISVHNIGKKNKKTFIGLVSCIIHFYFVIMSLLLRTPT